MMRVGPHDSPTQLQASQTRVRAQPAQVNNVNGGHVQLDIPRFTVFVIDTELLADGSGFLSPLLLRTLEVTPKPQDCTDR